MRSSSTPASRGFVLPTTLLVTTLLTVMLTAAFILVSAEHRTTDNSLASARALSLAQAGLQSYFASNRGLSSTVTYDSVRFTLNDGYADAVARRLRPAAGSRLALWVVRASGYSTDPRLGGQTQGKRVVAQLAQLNPGTLPARAAMVAVNGVQMIAGGGGSNANPIDGLDLSGVSCTGKPGSADTTGLTTASYNNGGSGSSPPPAPNNGTENLTNWSAVADSTHIDWASLLAGNFVPDYTIPPGPWPTPGSTNYLVGFANGDVTIPSSSSGRRGMLVVTGNVFVNGSHWDGIIIAGGRLDTPSSNPNANYTIHGMLITGLNGPGVPVNQIRRGGSRSIKWTWCYTQSTVNALSSMVPIKNGWVDTWTTY